MKKTTFFVRIFDISPCVFTQILRGRAHSMRNLIPHPTSTHTAHFWWTPLPQKQEIPEKMWWWHHHHIFFQVFLFLGGERPVKSIASGYSLDAKFNSASNELSRSKFEVKLREICQKYKQKSSFFYDTYPQIYIKKLFKRCSFFEF